MPKQKEKIYTSTEGRFFCPNCHREVTMPFKGANILGTIRIGCGNCKGGTVVIKASAKVETKK